MTLTRVIARPMLASAFVLGAVDTLRNVSAHAVDAKPVADKITPVLDKIAPQAPLPRDPENLVRLNAAAQIAAGLALATNRAPRLSASVLAASLVPTTLARHRFWEASQPETRHEQLAHFAKNTSLLGGLLLAAVDTDGKPGVAWRARRAATDARREARRLARSAKREAKLAAAQLG